MKDDTARFLLGGVAVALFGLYIWRITFGESRLNAEMMGVALGYIAAQAQSVINYYFGSSSGSTAKSQQLALQAK